MDFLTINWLEIENYYIETMHYAEIKIITEIKYNTLLLLITAIVKTNEA